MCGVMLAHGGSAPSKGVSCGTPDPCIDKPTCFGLRQENPYRLDAPVVLLGALRVIVLPIGFVN